MEPTICRSFWGNGQLSFFKSERDIVTALNAKRPTGRVYAFGSQAKYFLDLCRIPYEELPDKIPAAYTTPGHPPASMWWHKLVAIRQCLLDTKGPVIHLDWDTECHGPIPDMSKGPAFQGRLRWYSRPQCCHRPRGESKRIVYHGGCMYFRDVATIDRVLEFHAANCRQYADEAAVSQVADEIVGDEIFTPEAHRSAGLDNPLFYSTGRDVLETTISPAFREGPRVASETAIPFVSGLIAATIANRHRRNKSAGPTA